MGLTGGGAVIVGLAVLGSVVVDVNTVVEWLLRRSTTSSILIRFRLSRSEVSFTSSCATMLAWMLFACEADFSSAFRSSTLSFSQWRTMLATVILSKSAELTALIRCWPSWLPRWPLMVVGDRGTCWFRSSIIRLPYSDLGGCPTGGG